MLYFPDCPHWRVADERLREVSDNLRLTIDRQLVTTLEEADRVWFRGSPRILIDGVEPFAVGDDNRAVVSHLPHTRRLVLARLGDDFLMFLSYFSGADRSDRCNTFRAVRLEERGLWSQLSLLQRETAHRTHDGCVGGVDATFGPVPELGVVR